MYVIDKHSVVISMAVIMKRKITYFMRSKISPFLIHLIILRKFIAKVRQCMNH